MVEYWKEQDAFYKPGEFGLYDPYEVSAKFVAPKGFSPNIVPVMKENAAPIAPNVEYGADNTGSANCSLSEKAIWLLSLGAMFAGMYVGWKIWRVGEG